MKIRDSWRKCDSCGQRIALKAFDLGGGAKRRLITPDSDYSSEEWETLCPKCTEGAGKADIQHG